MRSLAIAVLAFLSISGILPSIGHALELRAPVTLRGRVLDSVSKETLPGASVVLEPSGFGRRTRSNGEFEFVNVESGRYAVHVRLIGYFEKHLELDLTANTELTILLVPEPLHGSDVIVTSKDERLHRETYMSEEELEAVRGQTLGETLEHIPGVTTLQTGASISKPVIRGLHSQRVTILNAGVAQEGQQWGAEHAPEVDPFAPTVIEVLKGASSVEFGAGAIGGVIRLVPRELPTSAGIRGSLTLNAFSNNRQGAGSLLIEGGLRGAPGFGWRVQGSGRIAGDSRTPDYVLGNTAFKEDNLAVSSGYSIEAGGVELHASRFSSTIGIFSGSHVGNKEDLERAIERGQPAVSYNFDYSIEGPYQTVTHDLLSLGAHTRVFDAGRLELHYGLQQNDRSEFEKQRDPTKPARETMNLKLLTHSLDLKFSHDPADGWYGSVGVNGIRQGNTGSGFDVLIPNYRLHQAGVYALENYLVGNLTLTAGARFDLNATTVYPLVRKGIEGQEHRFSSLSGAVGASYQLSSELNVRLNAASAWRPPSINELHAYGVHHGTAQFEVGDSSLREERSVGMDLTARYQTASLAVEVSTYLTTFDGFITLSPTRRSVLTVNGAFPEFKYEQRRALLRGAELSINYQILEELSAHVAIASVRGDHYDPDQPVYGMPPDRLQVDLRYLVPDLRIKAIQHTELHLGLQAVSEHDNLLPEQDLTPPPPGYVLVDARLSTELHVFGGRILTSLEVQNLLNTTYKDYLSRYRYFAHDPGRNFVARLSIPFGS